MWFGRAHAVRGRMFTWEVLTDFDGDIAAPALEESFRRDFPGMEERPVFWRKTAAGTAFWWPFPMNRWTFVET